MDLLGYLSFLAFPRKREIPTHRFPSVRQISPTLLKSLRIRAVVFDMDDTLSAFGGKVGPKNRKFLKSLSENANCKLAVFSNSSPARRAEMESWNLPLFVHPAANKPSAKELSVLVKKLKVSPRNCAFVGDRIGMDLYGAFLLGFPARILVNPLSNRAPLHIRLFRAAERLLSGEKK